MAAYFDNLVEVPITVNETATLPFSDCWSEIERILGIFPGNVKNVAVGKELGGVVDDRVIIQGFLPNGPAVKCLDMGIGDVIEAINNTRVSTSNIDKLLSKIEVPAEIILTLRKGSPQKPIQAVQQPKRIPLINLSLHHDTSGPALLDKIRKRFFVLRIIPLTPNSNEQEYLFSKDIGSVKQSSRYDALRGVIITLSDIFRQHFQGEPARLQLLCDEKEIEVSFATLGNNLLFLGAEQELMPCQLLCEVTVKMLHLLIAPEIIKSKLLSPQAVPVLDSLIESIFDTFFLRMEMEEQLFISFQYPNALRLPATLDVTINDSLSELLSNDFGEQSDFYRGQRRAFTLNGCLLYYKDYLVSDHMPSEFREDLDIYLRFFNYLPRNAPHSGMLTVWKEIFASYKECPSTQIFSGRFFCLTVGMKYFTLLVLLETAGPARLYFDDVPPNNLYVEQVRETLYQLRNAQVDELITQCIENEQSPLLSSADSFVSHSVEPHMVTPKPSTLKKIKNFFNKQGQAPPRKQFTLRQSVKVRQRSASPVARSNTLRTNRPKPEVISSQLTTLAGETHDARLIQPEASTGGGLQRSLRRRRNSAPPRDTSNISISSDERLNFSAMDLSKNRTGLTKSVSMQSLDNRSLGSGFEFDAQGDVNENINLPISITAGNQNTLFCFLFIDHSNKTLFQPTLHQLSFGGPLYAQVISNFYVCAMKLRKQFHSRSKRKPIELGMLFHCKPLSQDANSDKKTITYWVVGRLLKNQIGDYEEVYVCYHDSCPENILELSFKLKCFL